MLLRYVVYVLVMLFVGKTWANESVLNQLLLEDAEPVVGIPAGETISSPFKRDKGESFEKLNITREKHGNQLIFRKKIKLHRTCRVYTTPVYETLPGGPVFVTCLQSAASTTIMHTTTTFTSLHRYTKTINIPIEGDPVTKIACDWKYTTATCIVPTGTTVIKVIQSSTAYCSTPQITTYLIETQLIDDCVTV